MGLVKQNNRSNYFRGVVTEVVVAWVYFASGYKILARRYRTQVGEVDIIAEKDNTLNFIEVKLRACISGPDSPLPLKQQKRIARAAYHFLSQHHMYSGYNVSFDFAMASSMRNINIIQNAWQCDDWDLCASI
ncbi:hypothetical protein Sarmat_00307 [Rickettsiales endosymbiont of Paramecium tredecaurelia]|uniref:YraN family protein n=1 Tax=Candidatus Sarmatiella mevalonica TaxID=2770581 RepID=UPI001FC8D23D|nr:YraN family protein [Candidatus Sarmatiella mevalonica]MBL3284461.1 hypothetical protein [Candidatus Sarmatiella mevalonica]